MTKSHAPQGEPVVDWSTMPAGRELDALVAEHLFGWRWQRSGEGENRFEWLNPPAGEEWRCLYGARKLDGAYDYFSANLPHFSTDIAAAWEVGEKLRAGWAVYVYNDDGDWHCELDEDGGYREVRATAPTAPLAICRAALTSETPKETR